MKPITVLLAEDHTIIREGLAALLKSDADIEVIGEAANGREAVQLTRSLCPDVVVMDIAMPLLNGLEATRQILAAAPATRVLILSGHSDDACVEQALALGAAGYLLKRTSSVVLSESIRQIHRGSLCLSSTLSRHLQRRREAIPGSGVLKSQAHQLTRREMEVLQLVAEGKANKVTADMLHISVKTVEKHRQQVMRKLDLHNIASLTRYAIANGIIESHTPLNIP